MYVRLSDFIEVTSTITAKVLKACCIYTTLNKSQNFNFFIYILKEVINLLLTKLTSHVRKIIPYM